MITADTLTVLIATTVLFLAGQLGAHIWEVRLNEKEKCRHRRRDAATAVSGPATTPEPFSHDHPCGCRDGDDLIRRAHDINEHRITVKQEGTRWPFIMWHVVNYVAIIVVVYLVIPNFWWQIVALCMFVASVIMRMVVEKIIAGERSVNVCP